MFWESITLGGQREAMMGRVRCLVAECGEGCVM